MQTTGQNWQLERKPLDQIYRDWDKENLEIKEKFARHCKAMQDLELAELASQTQIERLNNETMSLERRQRELENFVRNNTDTQSALESELIVLEKELDDQLRKQDNAQQPGQLQSTDAAARRDQMFDEAMALDRRVDNLTRQMVDVVERLNASAGPSTTDASVRKVEAILNEQYKTLQWVEAESESLRQAVSALSAEQ